MADRRARSRNQPGPCEVEGVEDVMRSCATLALSCHPDSTVLSTLLCEGTNGVARSR